MLAATLLALASAGLHATWNLIIKRADDRELAALGQFLAGAVIFAPVLLFTGLPDRDAWPFLLASGLVHGVYIYALVTAYHHGDFSLAYPLARGGGALVAAVVGAIVLGDSLPAGAWCALVVVAVGLATLMQPSTPRNEIVYALLTAAVIGVYTVIDTQGSRHSDSGFVYTCALMIVSATTLAIAVAARGRAGEFVTYLRGNLWVAIVSGIFLTLAYALVLIAVRFAPVGYVATLRESSVVLGAVLGWLVLGEAMGRRRTMSSVVITAGLLGLVLFR